MRMVRRYLRSVYPDERDPPPASWCRASCRPTTSASHIRRAVNIAGADRIGHGADLRWAQLTRSSRSMKGDLPRKRI